MSDAKTMYEATQYTELDDDVAKKWIRYVMKHIQDTGVVEAGENDLHVLIFAWDTGCPYTQKCLDVIQKHKLRCVGMIRMSRDPSRSAKDLKTAVGSRTLPIVFVREGNKLKHIGGCLEFGEWAQQSPTFSHY